MHTTKALSRVEIKDAAKGEVTAVFSTLNVIDSDGDVTLKGAFTDGAPVVISAYGHGSWKGQLPVGKGVIRETQTEAVLEGRFFMDTTHGKDTFLTVKALSDGDSLQEWSYSLEDVKSHKGTHDGENVQFIDAVTVKEVSPVLAGAGVDTRTLTTKGKQLSSELNEALRNAGRERWGDDSTYVWVDDFDLDEGWVVFSISPDDGENTYVQVDYTRSDEGAELGDEETPVDRTTDYVPKGTQFSEHAKSVLADVDALITRATDVMALRARKGKGMSASSVDLLSHLETDLERLKGLLVAPPPPSDSANDALVAEFLRFVATSQGALQP